MQQYANAPDDRDTEYLRSRDNAGLSLPAPSLNAAVRAVDYASKSEYACGKLLEHYCGWTPIPGVTFQISAGAKLIDFRVRDTFIEYHPITLSHEFLNHNALREIVEVAKRLRMPDRVKLFQALTSEAQARYVKSRLEVLAAIPEYSSCRLVVAWDSKDFIKRVIVPLHSVYPLPPRGSLEREFRDNVREAVWSPKGFPGG